MFAPRVGNRRDGPQGLGETLRCTRDHFFGAAAPVAFYTVQVLAGSIGKIWAMDGDGPDQRLCAEVCRHAVTALRLATGRRNGGR